MSPALLLNRKKLVVVGDGFCGKTSLLNSYFKQVFLFDHQPTLIETYTSFIEVDDKKLEFVIWDTPGQDEYERLRPLIYKDSNVILVCYSIDMPDSLENVIDKWYPEIKYFCPQVPIILVGIKKDLRNDPISTRRLKNQQLKSLKTEDGQIVAKRIKAFGYFECSCKTSEGVRDIFQSAARATLLYSNITKKSKSSTLIKNSKKCTLL